MVTPKKLAARTYPGLRELQAQLKKFIESLSLQPIELPSILHHNFRKKQSCCRLNSVSFVVEHLLAQSDLEPQYKLSADARCALRTALSSSQHFVAVILKYFYDSTSLLRLFQTKAHIDDVYAAFGRIISNSKSFPLCKSLWSEIRTRKDRFERKISKNHWLH